MIILNATHLLQRYKIDALLDIVNSAHKCFVHTCTHMTAAAHHLCFLTLADPYQNMMHFIAMLNPPYNTGVPAQTTHQICLRIISVKVALLHSFMNSCL
jgi:hypothetical protein